MQCPGEGMTGRPKRPRDANKLAKQIVDLATGNAQEPKPSPQHVHAGSIGGRVRSERLSAERREQIAKGAVNRRWGKNVAPSEEG
jgi:hypothetical protein